MGVLRGVPSCSELQSLLVNEFNHIEVTSIKEVMMQPIKETLAEFFELGSQAANTGINSDFFRFMEMALVDTIQKKSP